MESKTLVTKSRWTLLESRKPPNGRKVLCWNNNGDCWTSMRLDDHWFAMPFSTSQWAGMVPLYWQNIDYPEGNSDQIRIKIHERIMDVDTFKKEFPKQYETFKMEMVAGIEEKMLNQVTS